MNKANECTCPSGDGSLVHPCPAHPAAERSELWAVHAQGPDELYAAFSREDAEKHAAELNALPRPEGIAVGAVVVPSPWPAVQHWQYLAEQEQDHKNEIAGRLRQLERICEGLPQDAIDGGWTVQGIRGYAKRLEDQLKAALAQVEALRAELQSQRERNTELIFKLGSATNGWGAARKSATPPWPGSRSWRGRSRWHGCTISQTASMSSIETSRICYSACRAVVEESIAHSMSASITRFHSTPPL